MQHTTVGDPEVDALLQALDADWPAQKQDWIRQGVEGGPAALAEAPAFVRDFFARLEQPPAWWQPAQASAGCRAFHAHSQMFIGAFVGAVLIEGFATLISKSFSITGRIVDQGVRRLKQNNRHLVEIFLPGGLERHGDGWKLSVRVRLVHGQVRSLLRRSDEWDAAAWGTPLSAAHMAFATASFSAQLLKRARTLGVHLTAEERASFMQVWRYSGHLMGVPPGLLFTSEDEALEIVRIGSLCEPPPSLESCQLAHALINAAPVVAQVDGVRERRALVRKIYRISRALIGDTRADALRYPPAHTLGVLAALRWGYRARRLADRLLPGLAARSQVGQFAQILDLSHYDGTGMAYRLPEHVHAEKDAPL